MVTTSLECRSIGLISENGLCITAFCHLFSFGYCSRNVRTIEDLGLLGDKMTVLIRDLQQLSRQPANFFRLRRRRRLQEVDSGRSCSLAILPRKSNSVCPAYICDFPLALVAFVVPEGGVCFPASIRLHRNLLGRCTLLGSRRAFEQHSVLCSIWRLDVARSLRKTSNHVRLRIRELVSAKTALCKDTDAKYRAAR
ncbi:hypothetical protein K461DRAFT_73655 [Myriangium duriaei CBS 260.36]|uniref:Uncharacterized protein n=1 Tax=Myriangium duriaei CBS 260.36 TaxID=1168546 RepID=A0A9P4IVX9_9PEZI|nr:hypothetical protein K461DRAFT_73655 [Myriangium duriaei CBS 260.36]